MAALSASLRSRIELYRRDVPAFASDVFGVEKWDPQQLEVLAEIPDHRAVAVVSGYSTGKGFIASVVSGWRWYTGFPCGVITTAPTGRQVNHLLWSEIRQRFAVARKRWPTQATVMESPIIKHPNPQALFIGFATEDQPDFFSGFHRKEITVVADESSGISAAIWRGIESVITGPNDKLLAIGNPCHDLGCEFYGMFSRNANLYRRFTLDSEKSSHCSKEWIARIAKKYGEDSDVYRMMVKGIWPQGSSESLIWLAWVEAAQARHAAHVPRELCEPSLGVDVARSGAAETVFVLLRDFKVEAVWSFAGQDLMETVGKIVMLVRDGRVKAENVLVDDTGLGGGVTDRLRELALPIRPMNFGEAATDPDHFINARGEMHWAVRDALRDGAMSLPPDDVELFRQLLAPHYKIDSRGRVVLEPKDQVIKRLKVSPDRADALALATWGMRFAAQGPATTSTSPLRKNAGQSVDRAPFRTSVRTGDPHWGRRLRDRRGRG